MGFSEHHKKDKNNKGLQLTMKHPENKRLKETINSYHPPSKNSRNPPYQLINPQTTRSIPNNSIDNFFKDPFVFQH